MWWEFGEHVASGLAAVGLTEDRWQKLSRLFPWLACHCDARRAWLNELGERFYCWLDWEAYAKLHRRWLDVVDDLSLGLFTDQMAHDTVSRQNLRISLHTTRRWLEYLVSWDCLVAMTEHVVVNGRPVQRRWYSLPPVRQP
jgi:transposase